MMDAKDVSDEIGDEVGEKFHCEISHSPSSAACCEVSSAKAKREEKADNETCD